LGAIFAKVNGWTETEKIEMKRDCQFDAEIVET
jgi:hypothetical protein